MKKLLLVLGIVGIIAAVVVLKRKGAGAELTAASGAEVFDAPPA